MHIVECMPIRLCHLPDYFSSSVEVSLQKTDEETYQETIRCPFVRAVAAHQQSHHSAIRDSNNLSNHLTINNTNYCSFESADVNDYDDTVIYYHPVANSGIHHHPYRTYYRSIYQAQYHCDPAPFRDSHHIQAFCEVHQ